MDALGKFLDRLNYVKEFAVGVQLKLLCFWRD